MSKIILSKVLKELFKTHFWKSEKTIDTPTKKKVLVEKAPNMVFFQEKWCDGWENRCYGNWSKTRFPCFFKFWCIFLNCTYSVFYSGTKPDFLDFQVFDQKSQKNDFNYKKQHFFGFPGNEGFC